MRVDALPALTPRCEVYMVITRQKAVTFKAVLAVTTHASVNAAVGHKVLRPVEFVAIVRIAARVRRYLNDWRQQQWPDRWE